MNNEDLINSIRNENIIESLTANTSSSLSITNFLLNLFIGILLSSFLSYIYIKYGTSLSNRRYFANNFVILCVTTLIVITIVKSSLALSLGLVGALSIVRFRTAIKEPEELIYTFLAIAVGLGLGAGQTIITILGLLVTIIFIVTRRKVFSKPIPKSTNLLLTLSNPEEIDNLLLFEILKKHCYGVNLQRLFDDSNNLEATISLQILSYKNLLELKSELKKNFPEVILNFLDNSGSY